MLGLVWKVQNDRSMEEPQTNLLKSLKKGKMGERK